MPGRSLIFGKKDTKEYIYNNGVLNPKFNDYKITGNVSFAEKVIIINNTLSIFSAIEFNLNNLAGKNVYVEYKPLTKNELTSIDYLVAVNLTDGGVMKQTFESILYNSNIYFKNIGWSITSNVAKIGVASYQKQQVLISKIWLEKNSGGGGRRTLNQIIRSFLRKRGGLNAW